VVISQQCQRTDATEVGSRQKCLGFASGVTGKLNRPSQIQISATKSDISDGDSAGTLSCEDMLAALQIRAGCSWVLIWKTLLAFLFLKDVFLLISLGI